MRDFMVLFLIINLLHTLSSYYIKNDQSNITLNNISFGSCFYGIESTRLDIFEKVLFHNPQLWMWTGDAAYVDERLIFTYYKSTNDVNFTYAKSLFDEARNLTGII